MSVSSTNPMLKNLDYSQYMPEYMVDGTMICATVEERDGKRVLSLTTKRGIELSKAPLHDYKNMSFQDLLDRVLEPGDLDLICHAASTPRNLHTFILTSKLNTRYINPQVSKMDKPILYYVNTLDLENEEVSINVNLKNRFPDLCLREKIKNYEDLITRLKEQTFICDFHIVGITLVKRDENGKFHTICVQNPLYSKLVFNENIYELLFFSSYLEEEERGVMKEVVPKYKKSYHIFRSRLQTSMKLFNTLERERMRFFYQQMFDTYRRSNHVFTSLFSFYQAIDQMKGGKHELIRMKSHDKKYHITRYTKQ